jgi:hypothetical protein
LARDIAQRWLYKWRQDERFNRRALDQVEGDFVFGDWHFVGGANLDRNSKLGDSRVSRDNDLVFLPVLLFRVLCDREVCGFAVPVFGALVVCVLFFWEEEITRGGRREIQ